MQHLGDAISYAEAKTLVHRDVKPANILSTHNGIYKLADLGIATRLSKDGASDGRMHGTPLYMSPEQAMGKAVDTRTDIYGLGASIWHLITGSPVFPGNPREVIGAHMHRPVPDLAEAVPDCHPGLRELVMAMLAKSPEDRPRNGREIIDRATAFAGIAEVVSSSGSRRRTVSRSVARRGAGRRQGTTRRRSTRKRRR
jgi:serine/threonine-protein kinase